MAHEQGYSRRVISRFHFSLGTSIGGWLMFLFLCLFSFSAQAGEVTLAWDPPSTEYGGFILAYGTSSGSYSHTKDI